MFSLRHINNMPTYKGKYHSDIIKLLIAHVALFPTWCKLKTRRLTPITIPTNHRKPKKNKATIKERPNANLSPKCK